MTPFLLTAPGRSRTLRATLRSLAASDLPAPRVFIDPGGPPVRPAERPVRGFRALLTAAVAENTAPWLLCLEDDIALHPRLLHHLTHWLPFRRSRIRTFASLYNPTLPCAPGTRPARRWLRADPRFFYGAQALLIARPFDLHALREWDTVPGMQSQRLAAIATRDFPGTSLYVHTPRSCSTSPPAAPGACRCIAPRILHRRRDPGGAYAITHRSK